MRKHSRGRPCYMGRNSTTEPRAQRDEGTQLGAAVLQERQGHNRGRLYGAQEAARTRLRSTLVGSQAGNGVVDAGQAVGRFGGDEEPVARLELVVGAAVGIVGDRFPVDSNELIAQVARGVGAGDPDELVGDFHAGQGVAHTGLALDGNPLKVPDAVGVDGDQVVLGHGQLDSLFDGRGRGHGRLNGFLRLLDGLSGDLDLALAGDFDRSVGRDLEGLAHGGLRTVGKLELKDIGGLDVVLR